MTSSWSKFLSANLENTQREHRLRQRTEFSAQVCNFGSNDYLGLRHDRRLRMAAKLITEEVYWGSGASPVVGGYSSFHQALDRELAKLSQQADCITFSSGFACHLGVIACLLNEGDAILSDQLNHASLIDGCRLATRRSPQSCIVYPHCDCNFVSNWLATQRHRFEKVLIVTESVFSMDGDLAPLRDLADIALRYDAGLLVDEAHATGLFGENGGGLTEELAISNALLLKLGTLSKALGSIGGYAAGPSEVIQYLVNHCRSYLFSTAPPAAVTAVSLAAVQLLPKLGPERAKLRADSSQLRQDLRHMGCPVPIGDSPIIPVIVGREESALAMSQQLLLAGMYVPAIRPPTVPPGTSRLRISLSTQHTPAQTQALVQLLGELLGA